MALLLAQSVRVNDVFDNQHCSAAPTSFLESDGVALTNQRQALTTLRLRFCGDVRTRTRSGGLEPQDRACGIALGEGRGRSLERRRRTWAYAAIKAKSRAEGFRVELNLSWSRSRGYGIGLDGSGHDEGSSHECPYPYK